MKKTEQKRNPEPDAQDVDLLRLRAEARALLKEDSGAPIYAVKFAKSGGICESIGATVQRIDGPDREYIRNAGETEQEFELRVSQDLPVHGVGSIIFWPRPDENDPLNSDVEP